MPVDYQKIAEMLMGAYPQVQQGLQSAREGFVDPSATGAVAAAMNALPAARGGIPRPYKNVPDQLMGFRRNGPNRGYEQEMYPHDQPVIVDFGGGNIFEDSIKGMNRQHAIERAYRNWPDATITIPEAK